MSARSRFRAQPPRTAPRAAATATTTATATARPPSPARARSAELQSLAAGPEHCTVLDATKSVHLWGSNEFKQLGAPGDPAAVYAPLRLGRLGARKVLSLACGGSHTLAVVSDDASATAGAAYAWGTGTVGQLGQGAGYGREDRESAEPLKIALTDAVTGADVPVRRVAAGMVSSGLITAAGDAYVWGDASLGRLGLASVPDGSMCAAGGQPILVNAGVPVWRPARVDFSAEALGPGFEAVPRPYVVDVAMGGAFTLFLLHPGSAVAAAAADAGTAQARGGLLLMSGSLGVDITKDGYGYEEQAADVTEAEILREIRRAQRSMTPVAVVPFKFTCSVLAVAAGVRHAAVISTMDGPPRVFTAGKGWLGQDAEALLLPRPTLSAVFRAVGGALADANVTAVACGHSHTLVSHADGRLFSWGRGDSGELGHGTLNDCAMPRPLRAPKDHYWSDAAAGNYYCAALAVEGAPPAMQAAGVVDVLAARLANTVVDMEWVRADEEGADGAGAGAGAGADPAADGDELPEGWDFGTTEDGETYYIRPDGETVWDDPRAPL